MIEQKIVFESSRKAAAIPMDKLAPAFWLNRLGWLIFPIFVLAWVSGLFAYFLFGHPRVAVALWAGGSCPLVIGLAVELSRKRPPDPRQGRRSVQSVGLLTVAKSGVV